MMSDKQHRVLVVAPTDRDAHLLCEMLREDGIVSESCGGVRQVCHELRAGVGAVLLTEEALWPGALAHLSKALGEQPKWSDVPVILLTSNVQRVTTAGGQMFRENGARSNLVVVEKPFRPQTLRSTVNAALTTRAHQYEVRDYLEEGKRAEEALQKAHWELARVTRVATLGELTASIAHEINQPLVSLVAHGYACLRWLEREVPDLDEARKSAQRIVENGLRAGEVIKGIRSLVKKTRGEKERLNINETIREVIALTARELTQNSVALSTDLPTDIPPVLGDRVQLQQVLLNLILNSTEAMSGVDWPVRELVIRSQESKRGEVLVTVRDSGTGLGLHDPERIFDSFFSTKPGGLGLGLSISRTIVEAHGGRLWAAQNNDTGATFHCILPAVDEGTPGS